MWPSGAPVSSWFGFNQCIYSKERWKAMRLARCFYIRLHSSVDLKLICCDESLRNKRKSTDESYSTTSFYLLSLFSSFLFLHLFGYLKVLYSCRSSVWSNTTNTVSQTHWTQKGWFSCSDVTSSLLYYTLNIISYRLFHLFTEVVLHYMNLISETLETKADELFKGRKLWQ